VSDGAVWWTDDEGADPLPQSADGCFGALAPCYVCGAETASGCRHIRGRVGHTHGWQAFRIPPKG
jgi:hypothetical protein